MMQQTSIEAYLTAKENLNDKQQAVYDVLKRCGTRCNQELANILGWSINRVTPRVLELRDKGKVEEAYRDTYPETNRRVIFWRITV